MSEQTPQLHRIPGKPDYRWSEPTLGQMFWLTSFLLAAYIAYRELLEVPAIILVILAVAGAWPFLEAPGYVLAGRWVKNRGRRRHDDGVIYSTNLADTLYEAERPSRVKNKQLRDVKLVSVPIRDKAGKVHQLGLLHTPTNNCDTSVVAGSGWPAAVAADNAERMMLDATYAGALKRCANRTRSPLTLAQFWIKRPADDSEAVRYMSQRLDKAVRFEEGLLDPTARQDPVDAAQADEMATAIDQVYSVGTSITAGIAVRAPRPKSWSKHSLDNLPEELVVRSPLFQTIEVLSNDLQNMGVRNVRRLSLFSLNALVRSVFDVYDLATFYSHLAVDREREARGELTSLDQAMTLQRGPWPSNMYAGNDHLMADRTVHRTFWVRGFGITSVPPGFFQELFNIPDVWYTVSHYIETVPGRREYRRARIKRRLIRRKQEVLSGTSESDPAYEEQSAQAADEHYALYRSASRGTRTRLMITISSLPERLEIDKEAVDAVCRGKDMILQPYYGEVVQDDAMLATIAVVR